MWYCFAGSYKFLVMYLEQFSMDERITLINNILSEIFRNWIKKRVIIIIVS